MTIRVLTFDLDDTLWDVRPALIKAEQAQNQWLTRHYPQALEDLTETEARARKKQLLKAHPELGHNVSRFRQVYLEQLLMDAGVPAPEAREGALAAFAEFIARRHDVALFEHAYPVLETLSERFLIGALTNGNADVGKTPLARFFQFALKAEDVGAAKPEPDLFHAALEHADARADELLHVGDSHDHDIEGAHRAGVASIWLAPEGEASDLALTTIHCLSELPAVLGRV